MAASLLAHDVFFTLKNPSLATRQKLVYACKKNLADHPSLLSFASGVLVETLDREVNDRTFDVGLHIVFADQEAPLHITASKRTAPTGKAYACSNRWSRRSNTRG
jgi:hypothetical protein